MRDELMSEIIKLEWDMFSHVSNVGGPASCQMRPDTFKIMRKSQAATWSDELLASYLEDLKAATREGRNIMTEKYARMMESTFPEEYRKLAASLPPVDKETLQKIEEIVAINVGWKAELFDRYPRLSGKHAAGTAAVVVELLQLINGGHQLPLLRIVQLVGQQVFPVEGAPGGFPADHRADTGHGLVQGIGHRQVPLSARCSPPTCP